MDDVTKYPTTGTEYRFQDNDGDAFVLAVEDGHLNRDGSGCQRLFLDREDADGLLLGPNFTIAQAKALFAKILPTILDAVHTTLGEIRYGPQHKEAAEEMADLVRAAAPLIWAVRQDVGSAHAWEKEATAVLEKWSACLK